MKINLGTKIKKPFAPAMGRKVNFRDTTQIDCVSQSSSLHRDVMYVRF